MCIISKRVMAVYSSRISLKPTKDDNSNNNDAVKLSSERHDVQKVEESLHRNRCNNTDIQPDDELIALFFFSFDRAHDAWAVAIYLFIFVAFTALASSSLDPAVLSPLSILFFTIFTCRFSLHYPP